MLSDEIATLRDQLAAASKEGRLNPVQIELAFAKLTDLAARVIELERRVVAPAARLTETDLGSGRVLVLRP